MGGTVYNYQSRSVRATKQGYSTKHVDDIFEQNRKRQIHESMEPSKALLREARDSESHPLSVPIMFSLDVTGSMGRIPHQLIKEGLPKMMSQIMERGINDPQILFVAIGDHKSDYYPFQVGQFESGDEELDMWLTRTYLEGNGGGNNGESYMLPWYFASQHVVTDAWEKRGEKGFIITVGDERCHDTLPSTALKEIMGVTPEKTFTSVELLEMAKQKWNVFHIHILEGYWGEQTLSYWKELLGDNCIPVKTYVDVPKVAASIVGDNHIVKNSLIVDNVSNNDTPEKTDNSVGSDIKDQKINL